MEPSELSETPGIERRSPDEKYVPPNALEHFISAARGGDLNAVERELAVCPELLNRCGDDGYSALHWSADKGHADVVALLLFQKADVDLLAKNDGRTALHDAAEFGHVDVCSLLVSHGANPNIQERNYAWTALHFAAQNGHDRVCAVLGPIMINININSSFGTALHAAATFGRLQVVYELLRAGADHEVEAPTGGKPSDYARRAGKHDVAALLSNKDPEAVRHVHQRTEMLIEDAKKGDLSGVKAVLKANPELVDALGPDHGYCALQWAADKGHLDVCRFLLEQKADVNKRSANDGRTSMHDAAEFGRTEVCKLLLEYKAEVTVVDSRYHWTPLHFASQNGHVEICELLSPLRNHLDSQDGSPLCSASLNGHLDVVKVLLRTGADREAICGTAKENARAFALQRGHDEIVSYLDTSEPSKCELRSRALSTLIEAAKENDLDAVKKALSLFPDTLDECGLEGHNALQWATDRGHMQICQYLLSCKASVNATGVVGGRTALHDAAEFGRTEVCQLLLRHQADPYMKDRCFSAAPLHYAAQNGHLRVCELLCSLVQPVDVTIGAIELGLTPLYMACANNRLDVVCLLMMFGADPQRPTTGGTAKHVAEVKGHREIVTAIVEATAEQSRGAYLIDERVDIQHELFALRAYLPLVHIVAQYCTALPLPPVAKRGIRLSPKRGHGDQSDSVPAKAAAQKK